MSDVLFFAILLVLSSPIYQSSISLAFVTVFVAYRSDLLSCRIPFPSCACVLHFAHPHARLISLPFSSSFRFSCIARPFTSPLNSPPLCYRCTPPRYFPSPCCPWSPHHCFLIRFAVGPRVPPTFSTSSSSMPSLSSDVFSSSSCLLHSSFRFIGFFYCSSASYTSLPGPFPLFFPCFSTFLPICSAGW